MVISKAELGLLDFIRVNFYGGCNASYSRWMKSLFFIQVHESNPTKGLNVHI